MSRPDCIYCKACHKCRSCGYCPRDPECLRRAFPPAPPEAEDPRDAEIAELRAALTGAVGLLDSAQDVLNAILADAEDGSLPLRHFDTADATEAAIDRWMRDRGVLARLRAVAGMK